MIIVDVALYGTLAKLQGGKYVAQANVQFEGVATIKDLYEHLGISHRSYLFINAVLCDVPGLNATIEEKIDNGDHVGIFSDGYMWPYQYRDGAQMFESLQAALKEHGALHHTYKKEE